MLIDDTFVTETLATYLSTDEVAALAPATRERLERMIAHSWSAGYETAMGDVQELTEMSERQAKEAGFASYAHQLLDRNAYARARGYKDAAELERYEQGAQL